MEPLASRCAKFRFAPIEEQDAVARLAFIAERESFPVQQDALAFLISFCAGDLRKAINLLQSAHRFLSQRADPTLTLSFTHGLTGYIEPAEVSHFLKTIIGHLDEAPQLCASLIRKGYSATQFLAQLHSLVIASLDIKGIQKSLLAVRFSLYAKRLLDGADAELQLLSLAADLSHYMTAKKILLN